ncbi:hypothetical protein K2173_009016 [Erythroxylum novogranatense]|uniref:DEAD-box ATP-dependent RNA helicase 50 n=1 Tax=Erythroxylum novogranatense TaxID=1862640 RepID=A0AAV8TVI4_9ROSI|nr:hypothetical protein K2173_009016 [Erythroxylum novogranatense]
MLAKVALPPHSLLTLKSCAHGDCFSPSIHGWALLDVKRNRTQKVVAVVSDGDHDWTRIVDDQPKLQSYQNKDNENKDASLVHGNTGTESMSAVVSTRGVARSFGRLKAQKIKDLARRASQIKQKFREIRDGEALQDANQHVLTKVDDFVEHVEEVKEKTAHSSGYDNRVSRNRAEFSSPEGFRGWGKGGSVYSYGNKFNDPLQGRKKFEAENDFFSRKSFKELGCSEFMIESLKGQLILRPSHIQAMTFGPVIMGKSCIIADQSGSGKTLAYLIPVIQRLRQEELQGLGETPSRSPKVLIMVPTAELASQVLSSCRSISKFGVPFRSMVVTGGFRQRTQLENLEQGVDVLIATPGRFMYLIKEGFLSLATLKCVILDEIDIQFSNEDFEVALQSLINLSPVTAQYLFVTATLPVDVYNKLIEVFPDCEMIMGPGIHRTSTGLTEVLVDCSGENETEKTPESAFNNKKTALLQLVEQNSVSKTIVFCNKIETCRKVENVLKRFDKKGHHVRVLPFHAALAQESRLANMKEFMNSSPEEVSLFLVCTDRASRGIDFAGVDHVVLFDFPRDPSEYVRRVGRTARGAGGKGKAFIFVVGKQVFLARKTIERNQKGHPLHDVPAAYISG